MSVAAGAPRTRGATIRAVAVLVACLLLAAGGLALDRTSGAAAAVDPAPVPQGAARAGVWYCAPTAGEADPATVTVAAVGDEPSTVTVVRFDGGDPISDEPQQVAPGGSIDVVLAAGEATAPVAVRWTGGPASAAWRSATADAVAAPCAAEPSERWHFAGLDTAGGNRSLLHLFNPFTVDAVARITFATPEGPVSLVLTDNILVEAGGHATVDLAEFQPEQQDLGATVEVLTGRLVAAGEVDFSPRDEDADLRGRSLVAGAPAPATTWGFGYAGDDEEASSWLSIVNPGADEAAVQVEVSNPTADSPLTGEVAVPPGAVVRVDLAGTSEERWSGVAVRSTNDVPVVAARVTGIATRTDRHGVAASLGAAPSRRAALVGGGTRGRFGLVGLHNPSGEAAVVNVTVAGQRPPAWEALELPANAGVVLDLAEVAPDTSSTPVIVDASAPIVAELRSMAPGAQLPVWSITGVSAERWTGPAMRPPVRRDPSLVTQPVAPEPTEEPVPGGPAPARTPPREPRPDALRPTEAVPPEPPAVRPDSGEELVQGSG